MADNNKLTVIAKEWFEFVTSGITDDTVDPPRYIPNLNPLFNNVLGYINDQPINGHMEYIDKQNKKRLLSFSILETKNIADLLKDKPNDEQIQIFEQLIAMFPTLNATIEITDFGNNGGRWAYLKIKGMKNETTKDVCV